MDYLNEVITTQDLIDSLWKVGEISAFLNKSQLKIDEVFEATKIKNTKHVLNCSRKIGKSIYGLFKLSQLCIQKPNALCAYIAPTSDAVSALAEQLFLIVFNTQSPNLRPRLSKTELSFNNGSKIIFRGVGKGIGDSYDNLRSFSFDAIVLDEAGFSSHLDDIVDGALLDTLRARSGWMLLLSSPPKEGKTHPFFNYCEQAKLDGTYHEFTIEQSHYSKEQIEKAIREHGGRDSTSARRELFCEFIVEEEIKIVPEWDEDKYVKQFEHDEYYQFYHRYLSLDPSQGIDFTVCIFGYFDFIKQTLYIEDEIEVHGQDLITADIANAILNKRTSLNYSKPYLQLSDNSDRKLINDLAAEPYKLYFTPIENKGFKQTQVSVLREMVRQGRVIIHPRCKYLIGCLNNGLWKVDKNNNILNEFAKNKVFGHFDAIDALSYLLLNLNTHKNPIPQSYKATIDSVLPGGEIPGMDRQKHLPDEFINRRHKR